MEYLIYFLFLVVFKIISIYTIFKSAFVFSIAYLISFYISRKIILNTEFWSGNWKPFCSFSFSRWYGSIITGGTYFVLAFIFCSPELSFKPKKVQDGIVVYLTLSYLSMPILMFFYRRTLGRWISDKLYSFNNRFKDDFKKGLRLLEKKEYLECLKFLEKYTSKQASEKTIPFFILRANCVFQSNALEMAMEEISNLLPWLKRFQPDLKERETFVNVWNEKDKNGKDLFSADCLEFGGYAHHLFLKGCCELFLRQYDASIESFKLAIGEKTYVDIEELIENGKYEKFEFPSDARLANGWICDPYSHDRKHIYFHALAMAILLKARDTKTDLVKKELHESNSLAAIYDELAILWSQKTRIDQERFQGIEIEDEDSKFSDYKDRKVTSPRFLYLYQLATVVTDIDPLQAYVLLKVSVDLAKEESKEIEFSTSNYKEYLCAFNWNLELMNMKIQSLKNSPEWKEIEGQELLARLEQLVEKRKSLGIPLEIILRASRSESRPSQTDKESPEGSKLPYFFRPPRWETATHDFEEQFTWSIEDGLEDL